MFLIFINIDFRNDFKFLPSKNNLIIILITFELLQFQESFVFSCHRCSLNNNKYVPNSLSMWYLVKWRTFFPSFWCLPSAFMALEGAPLAKNKDTLLSKAVTLRLPRSYLKQKATGLCSRISSDKVGRFRHLSQFNVDVNLSLKNILIYKYIIK